MGKQKTCQESQHLWEYSIWSMHIIHMYVRNNIYIYLYMYMYTACDQIRFGFVLNLGKRIRSLANFPNGGQVTKIEHNKVWTNLQVVLIKIRGPYQKAKYSNPELYSQILCQLSMVYRWSQIGKNYPKNQQNKVAKVHLVAFLIYGQNQTQ